MGELESLRLSELPELDRLARYAKVNGITIQTAVRRAIVAGIDDLTNNPQIDLFNFNPKGHKTVGMALVGYQEVLTK